jgi:hypothetical protein
VTYALEPQGTSVKPTVLHEVGKVDSKLIEGVSNGWPNQLSSFKSLLETIPSPTPAASRGNRRFFRHR